MIAEVHRAQANALAIRARAEMRLAEEYDAGQERGEIGKHGGNRQVSDQETCKATDVLSPKDLHNFRKRRDREQADPGATRRALDSLIERGEEPTSAALDREMSAPAPKQRGSYRATNTPSRCSPCEIIDKPRSLN